jgi:hypothetical protein
VPIARQRQVAGLRRAAQPGAVDQLVVFDEAQEHADSSQCTPAWVMTWSTQVSKVSAVRSASRAACHSACRLALSSVTSSMRRSRSSSRRLSSRVRSARSWGALITWWLFLRSRSCAVLVFDPGLRQARARVLWMLFTIGTATPSMTGKPWWLVGSSNHTLGCGRGGRRSLPISVISPIRSYLASRPALTSNTGAGLLSSADRSAGRVR